MKITKIGIIFGDNDFGIVMRSFFAALLEARTDHYKKSDFTKDTFVEAYNSVIGGLYWLVQNPLAYNKHEHHEFPTFNYLKISAKDVLFNEEVEAYLMENTFEKKDESGDYTWCNGEFGWVDFETLAYHFK